MKKINMPIIESKRCILRKISIYDADDLFEYYKNEEILRYLPFSVHENLEETKRFIKNYFLRNYKSGRISHYAIVYKENNKVIGNIGFNNIRPSDKIGELGVCLNKNYWGNGIISEIVPHLIKFGFEDLGLNRITAIYFDGNLKSASVLEKSDLKYVSKKKERKIIKGKRININCHTYEINKHDYFKKNAK